MLTTTAIDAMMTEAAEEDRRAEQRYEALHDTGACGCSFTPWGDNASPCPHLQRQPVYPARRGPQEDPLTDTDFADLFKTEGED